MSIVEEMQIQDIHETFREVIYYPHSSYIESYRPSTDSLDDYCVNLEWEHQQGISDLFIDSLFEKVNFSVMSDDPEMRKHLENNWGILNNHVVELYQNFDTQSQKIHFASDNEKTFFRWFLGYFADRLGGGY
jgi:hypothetical protein